MKKLNIVVLFGGCCSEYSVSLMSAYALLNNIDTDKFKPIMIGITKKGQWLHFNDDLNMIIEDTWHTSITNKMVSICANRDQHQFIIVDDLDIKTISFDAVFVMLHGKNGEDGTVQGMLELFNIPFIGCNTLSSALCMDKDKAHKIVRCEGIKVPKSLVFNQYCDHFKIIDSIAVLNYPLFIKPVKGGSSIGITKVNDFSMLSDAINSAFEYDNEIIIEENIKGFEVGCAIMGNDELFVGEVDEIQISDNFFDFNEKYHTQSAITHLPARLDDKKIAEIKSIAKTIYRSLGCSGFARVDMFICDNGEIVFNEVNTIPGFSDHSRFPNMMKAKNIEFKDLITRLIELGVN